MIIHFWRTTDNAEDWRVASLLEEVRHDRPDKLEKSGSLPIFIPHNLEES